MLTIASGTFDVTLTPQPASADVGDPTVSRMAIAKAFQGDLEGASRGEMLAVRTVVDGSAGYVAMERFVGSLFGKEGSFALQHNGRMDRGAKALSVTVVPDSGTDELAGLSGVMRIDVVEGVHSYVFEVAFAPDED
jgi:hypothetical protein